jgi:hypothetical protein
MPTLVELGNGLSSEIIIEHTTIEPICAENGPLLVGLGNFMRWNLMVHPRTRLEMAV